MIDVLLAHLAPASIPGLVAALVILVSFGLLLVRSRFSTAATVLFLLGLIASAWQITLAFEIAMPDPETHRWITRLAMLFVCFVPTAAYHAATLLSYDGRSRRASIVVAWSASGLFGLLTIGSQALVAEPVAYTWGRYFVYGAGGVPFVVFCAIDGLAALRIVWVQWRRSPRWSRAARRSRLLVAGFAVGSIAMLDHLPALGIGLFPFGGVFFAAGGVLIATAALRYRLADLTPAAAAEPLLDQVSDGVLLVDADRIVRLANPAAAELLGVPRATLLQARVPARLDDVLPTVPLVADGATEPVTMSEFVHAGAAGARRVLSVSARRPTSREAQGATVYTVRDVTAVREASHTEAVADRALLRERIEQLLAQAQQAQRSAAVVLIDPSTSPVAPALAAAAPRLRACLRAPDLLLRHGGNLVVLLGPVAGRVAIEAVLDRLSSALPGIAAGVALYPDDSDDAQELLRRAWSALEALRESGRAGTRFHDLALHQRTLAQTGHEAALRRLVAAGPSWRFAPQVDVSRRAMCGVEMLWWAGDAAQTAELAASALRTRDTALVRAWTDVRLEAAVRAAVQLHAAGYAVPVTVPVSAHGVLASTLLEAPTDLLRRHGATAGRLRLALVPVNAPARLRGALGERLAALVQSGIALDIDRVDHAPLHLDDVVQWGATRARVDLVSLAAIAPPRAALEALRSLVASLGLEPVATGIDSHLHALAARAMGIAVLQGAFVAPAVESRELLRTLPAVVQLLDDPDHILPI
jgi:EAL domain-containing protein (putative c-di-GMP-specific phosphodiesterase class I)/PAS domain-containing protein